MQRINPFNELYVTETISPKEYVSLFSPILVEHATALFMPGNVVVRGVQGSGKSMLLNLLSTDIRLAYKNAEMDLPVPRGLNQFIGAGINISSCGALDFGQRTIESDELTDRERLPFYFGDFFNYWVVGDLIKSILKLSTQENGAIGLEIGLSLELDKLSSCIRAISDDPCWYGYLSGIYDLPSFRQAIDRRIATYRGFLNFNIESLPDSIRQTKTTIGEPISILVGYLREFKIVPESVAFFVQIDQYEELTRLKGWDHDLGVQYRRLLNKALGMRDSRVFYRIGSRRYAWEDDLQIFGSSSMLERERNYKIINMDDLLRRREVSSDWVFPNFARDVFERRLTYAGYNKPRRSESLLTNFLGKGLSPVATARRYSSTSSENVLSKPSSFKAGSLSYPSELREILTTIADSNPLEAKLAEAWFLQKGWDGDSTFLTSPKKPWNKTYWRKERIAQALMQIAARNSQRMLWSGEPDVLSLSGGNILVFVSLCQHIWAAWLRRNRQEENVQPTVPSVEPQLQAVGIHTASKEWYNKIPEQAGNSGQRQRFLDFMGAHFRDRLLEDIAMSYPGHNGFSLRNQDIFINSDVRVFLSDAADYGDIVDANHTTKSQDRIPRTKFYLNPILSPHFGIPHTHVKEPIYATLQDFLNWMSKARVISTFSSPKERGTVERVSDQMELNLEILFEGE